MKTPSERLIKAISLSSVLHRNHTRHDDDNTPYVSHLYSVATYIMSVTGDEDIIIAGLMHDSLEDIPEYYYDDLLNDCGENVAKLVAQVTEDHKLPYKEKKELYLEQIRNGDHRVLAISIADKIHNASTYNTLHEHKKHVGHSYMYNEIYKIAKDKIKNNAEYKYLEPLLIKLEEMISILIS